MTALLVIHDAGDPRAGSRWNHLVDAWPGPALAPDLPGHGETPPPTGGHYAPGDGAIAAWRGAEQAGVTGGDVVIVGHGSGAFDAEILAAAGRAARLAVVDGLGPPWRSVDELVADRHRWLREVFADPAALAPPTTAPDPRLAHGFPSIWDRNFIRNMRRSVTVPVVAVETPDSKTPPGERGERLADYRGPVTLLEVETADAVTAALLQA